MGWPILGDSVYGSAPRTGGPGLHLHAREIVVPLYKNRAPIQVTAPVPPHMHERLRACGWSGETLKARRMMRSGQARRMMTWSIRVIAGLDPAIHPASPYYFFSMDARLKPGHDEPRMPRRRRCDQYSVAFSRSGAVRSCSGPPILPWVRSARIVPALGRLLRSTWRDASHSFERTIALAH